MFQDAMNNTGRTENGMPTPISSMNALVDMFFRMGALRNEVKSGNTTRIIADFSGAYNQNKLLALKALFYNRDIREGNGERGYFRICYRWLINNDPDTALLNLPLIPEYGRWDDGVAAAWGTPLQTAAIQLHVQAIKDGNGLACKFAPREGKSHDDWAKGFAQVMGVSMRKYRKTIVMGTNVVETLMCAQRWEDINYSHIPSKAINQYRKAWYKHDQKRYEEWLAAVEKGDDPKVKINAGAIFPHEIIGPLVDKFKLQRQDRSPDGVYVNVYNPIELTPSEERQMNVQWAALPNWLENGNIFSICDVSWSMHGEPMKASLALGAYTAEHATGAFKDMLMAFSAVPTFIKLTAKGIADRVRQLSQLPWGDNTNIEAVFKMMLKTCVEHKVPASEMPKAIVIYSDMQFDQSRWAPNDTAYAMIRSMYANAGYEMPSLIFWNLRASSGVPVTYTTQGTALVSGFSPANLKSVLSGQMSPMLAMLRAINVKRYEAIQIHELK